MNISDFDTSHSAEDKLAKIDQLVEMGFSRERAERVLDRLFKIIDGPWADILTSTKRNGHEDYETAFLQTCLVAYMQQWADERLMTSALLQSFCIVKFAAEDADTKGAI